MSLFEKRVDAAVAEYDRHFSSRTQTVFGAGVRRTAMAGAIRAADAVVTEEMIAEVLRPLIRDHQGADDNDAWWVADHAHDYAQAVLALFGEVRSE